jgi:hypothetical protein
LAKRICFANLRCHNKKVYKAGTISQYLSPLGLCYWVADDGAFGLQKGNETILNSQAFSFTKKMNMAMCEELNKKFNLHSKVVKSKTYWAIYIPASHAPVFRELLKNLPSSMLRKLPKVKKRKANRCGAAGFSCLTFSSCY